MKGLSCFFFVDPYTPKRGIAFESVVAVGACVGVVSLTLVIWWGGRAADIAVFWPPCRWMD